MTDTHQIFLPANPAQVLFTVVVVLSEKVETTMQKGIFRAAGTVFGGAIGFAAMLRTQSATSPVLLVAVLCMWVFLGSWLALKTEVGPASNSLAPAALIPACHTLVARVVAFARCAAFCCISLSAQWSGLSNYAQMYTRNCTYKHS